MDTKKGKCRAEWEGISSQIRSEKNVCITMYKMEGGCVCKKDKGEGREGGKPPKF